MMWMSGSPRIEGMIDIESSSLVSMFRIKNKSFRVV
jgi:hypothetical protein